MAAWSRRTRDGAGGHKGREVEAVAQLKGDQRRGGQESFGGDADLGNLRASQQRCGHGQRASLCSIGIAGGITAVAVVSAPPRRAWNSAQKALTGLLCTVNVAVMEYGSTVVFMSRISGLDCGSTPRRHMWVGRQAASSARQGCAGAQPRNPVHCSALRLARPPRPPPPQQVAAPGNGHDPSASTPGCQTSPSAGSGCAPCRWRSQTRQSGCSRTQSPRRLAATPGRLRAGRAAKRARVGTGQQRHGRGKPHAIERRCLLALASAAHPAQAHRGSVAARLPAACWSRRTATRIRPSPPLRQR